MTALTDTRLERHLTELGYRAARSSNVARANPRVRELRSQIAELGLYVSNHPRVVEACLLLALDRLSEERLRREWEGVLSILRPEVSRRLALVAVGEKVAFSIPDRQELQMLASEAQDLLSGSATRVVPPGAPKFFDILHVLLVRWLLKEGPITRGELGEQAGCTYPTITRAMKRLGRAVVTHSNRSVELRAFPRQEWSELVVLSPTHRGSIEYVDASGKPPDLEGLLRRLQRQKPPHVAIGGVVAAHHWDPDFDLHGLPRLDLSVHATEELDLGFVERLDPGLQPADRPEARVALVVHPIRRPATMFATVREGELPIADPIETLLDLHELRLEAQAAEMIDRFKRRPA